MSIAPSSNPLLRIVIVGCGEISGAWFHALKSRADARIEGLVDLNESMARQRRDEFGLSNARIGNLHRQHQEPRHDLRRHRKRGDGPVGGD